MSALTNISKKLYADPRGHSNSRVNLEKISEFFWFSISFVLFVALGPFSAIPAFLAVMSLGNKGDFQEPEAV